MIIKINANIIAETHFHFVIITLISNWVLRVKKSNLLDQTNGLGMFGLFATRNFQQFEKICLFLDMQTIQNFYDFSELSKMNAIKYKYVQTPKEIKDDIQMAESQDKALTHAITQQQSDGSELTIPMKYSNSSTVARFINENADNPNVLFV